MKKICQICGEDSGMYPLCKKHLEMKAKGGVIKNEKNGKWELAKNEETKKQHSQLVENGCIICGAPNPDGPHCKKCYYEMLDFKDIFDKNKKMPDLSDYYYNLKNNIYRMFDFEKVKLNCNKLYALAILSEELHNNQSLSSRVIKDIQNIIAEKKPKENKPVLPNKQIQKKDSEKEELLRTIDGHKVKSQGEKIIDDILYNCQIAHAYSIDVAEIDTKSDRAIQCDWFIPVLSSSAGIYIEYWGMSNNKEYSDNKTEKLKLYEEYDLPLISIEKQDIDDTQLLQSRIRRELKELAMKYFKINKNF